MRILHVTAQRPSHTGSGTTLANLVAVGAERGLTQHVACGLPAGSTSPLDVQTSPLFFDTEGLEFALPGMSDVMPYRSTRYRDLDRAQLAAYRTAWTAHLRAVVDRFAPDVIHVHHLWLVASLCTDLGVPAVAHCHATGLRQRALCPHLLPEVDAGVARASAIVTLTAGQGEAVRALWPDVRIEAVGAGYREDVFHRDGRVPIPGRITYVGKLARSKGVPWLLDAFARVRDRRPGASLLVCGLGAGVEGDALSERIATAPGVHHLGMLTPEALAGHLRQSEVFALPSLYEGYGLVLIEALACGNRLVSTDFEAARHDLAPRVGDALSLVELPALRGVDEPVPSALPAFVDRLADALDRALAAGSVAPTDLASFTWDAVFDRVHTVWRSVT